MFFFTLIGCSLIGGNAAPVKSKKAPAPAAAPATLKSSSGACFSGDWTPENHAELEVFVKLLGVSPLDAIRWATRNGAELMGRAHELGTIEAGKLADIVLWQVERPAMLGYRIGINPCVAVMQGGRWRSREGLS